MKPKLIADMMLGRLARWLRLYGYDTVYGVKDDDEIIEIAKKEGRIILTRDEELAKRAKNAILISSNKFEEQIKQLMKLGFTFNELFPENARCPKCNGLIKEISKEKIKNRVPPRVYEKYNEFYICTKCGQIYWPGRQWEEMVKIDKRLRGS
ncbi:Mut7-C RNAse domain-containing protein [Thermococcus sp. SY098]|uniref:Mut7-C RNAse domain-containing protein n=1 Tax=Thermococcus sp. SY098 TaxID=3111325 RepID=UPI002D769A0E|nr:Mut7-C RNAse domain-containing protein [Thermococcus sp. SY098]WRS53377.1 Mut7-C RNAse domain-containing protein [Thermococcus sp. SY098]